jgi:uncharacterized protein YjbJ (UPF0337 family)
LCTALLPCLWNTQLAGAFHSSQQGDLSWTGTIVEGNWMQVKGKIKEQWGRLTDDDLDVIAGKRDQLEGKIQERYGKAKDEARREIDDWYNNQSW